MPALLDNFTLTYDKKTDVLVLQIGPSRDSFIIQETDDGLILQLDPETKTIVGIIVNGLSTRQNDVLPQLGSLMGNARLPNRDA